jgi:hypothetical protein
MRFFALSFALALALGACKSKSKPPVAPEPVVTEPAATEPGPATDADYDRVFTTGLAFFDELAASMEASGTDCKKMAGELDRIFMKFKALSDDSKRLEGNPDFESRSEAFMKANEDRVKAATAKMSAGMDACGEDADVQAAMQRFDEM